MKKKASDTSQLKFGAVLSYLTIFLNTVYGLVLSPFMLNQLGEANYGVYKTITSFSNTLLVMDMGIGTTVMRYTAKFRSEGKKKEIENFAAMGLIEAGIMSILLLIVGFVILLNIDDFYSDSFTPDQIDLSRILFLILLLNIVLVIIENVLKGVITGNNQFIFSNATSLLLLVLRIVSIVAVLSFWKSAVAIVLITLICSIINLFLQLGYILGKMNIKIKLYHWDKALFGESLKYTSLMFVQSIATQANGNIDNVVISKYIGPVSVAVYSFAIQMFNMYEVLATSFSGLMLPTVSTKIAKGASDEELQGLVMRVGRIQFMLLGAVLFGFMSFGYEFIDLWLGDGYEDVYILSLIMIVPVTFTLIQNVCLSILRAKNMMGFRTFSLIFTAVFNAVITVIGTKIWGYYAAAIGTAFSVMIGSVIMMNIYYRKNIGFKPLKFYGDVLHNLLLCAIVPAVVCSFISRYLYGNWFTFGIKVVVYIAVYFVLLMMFGLKNSEKDLLLGKLRKKKS